MSTIEDHKAKVAAFNAEAIEKFESDSEWRKATAQAATQKVYDNFVSDNLIGLFTEVEYLGLGETSKVRNVEGLKAFWMDRTGYIEESTLRGSEVEIAPDYIGIHVVEEQDRAAQGYAETLAKLVDLAGQRLRSEINRRVITLYEEAIPPGHTSYIGAVTGLDLTVINTELAAVQGESNAGVTIVGRSEVINAFLDAIVTAGYSEEVNDEIIRTGRLGTYRGAAIISLNDYKDSDGNAFVPANELYILGRDAGKTAFFGALRMKEFIEDDNWFWHHLMKLSVGTIVAHPERARRIVDGTISA